MRRLSPTHLSFGMSKQLLVRLTKWNRSRETDSPMRRNTRKQQYTSAFDKHFTVAHGSPYMYDVSGECDGVGQTHDGIVRGVTV